jgi:hypothetical protein
MYVRKMVIVLVKILKIVKNTRRIKMKKLLNRIMLEICWAIEKVVDFIYPQNTLWISFKFEERAGYSKSKPVSKEVIETIERGIKEAKKGKTKKVKPEDLDDFLKEL